MLHEVLVIEKIEEILNNKIEFCVAVHGDQYVVNLPNETYLTNHYGFEQTKYQPKFNFTGNHTFSMTKADVNSNYFIGRADFFNADSEFYLLKAGLNGSVIWYKEIEEFDDANLRTTQEGFIAAISKNNSNILSKHNYEGNMVWQKELNVKPDAFIPACNGGVILMNYNDIYNLLEVTKLKSGV